MCKRASKDELIKFVNYIGDKNVFQPGGREASIMSIPSYLGEGDDFCVILGAGHGGLNPATGQYTTLGKKFKHKKGEFHGEGWFYEGVWNRYLLGKVIEMLTELGIPHFVVSHDWLDNSLGDRIHRVNLLTKLYKKCLYISIHANALDGITPARGFDVRYFPTSTVSKAIASMHHNNTRRVFLDMGVGSIGLKEIPRMRGIVPHNLKVLRETLCPAILIEHLFFDNYDDAMMLMSSAYTYLFALAIVDTIKGYQNMRI